MADVGDDSDNSCVRDLAAQWIAAWKEKPRERVIADCDAGAIFAIAGVEQTTGDERDSEGLKIFRTDGSEADYIVKFAAVVVLQSAFNFTERGHRRRTGDGRR